ncbi:unnamed protein product [Didymodactylos carnosus]|uniref:Uncharacterized protein n=1 Tax=Didymodactylos carnosus TaxID=1234261 RepID=A0A8S2EX93_9BILA|nr:unnamed protein product [Didymodactylos carnosus]CAF4101555.1 unnamed protein product [Didymodactylos carnosus]
MVAESGQNWFVSCIPTAFTFDRFLRFSSSSINGIPIFQVAQEEESLQTIVRTQAALTASVFIDSLQSKAESESSVQCSSQKPSARPVPYRQNSSATKSYNPYGALSNRTHTPKKASPRCFGRGGNWCYDTGARIEYDKQQVSIRSYYGRSSIPYDKQIDTLALDLKLLNSVSIPPRESIVVQAKLDLSSAQFAYFHPDIDLQQSKCIPMASALLKIDKYSTFLEIYNPSEFSRTLYKNAMLGHVTYTPPSVASFMHWRIYHLLTKHHLR